MNYSLKLGVSRRMVSIMNLLKSLIVSATLASVTMAEEEARPWEKPFYCRATGQAIHVRALLCSVERGECRVLSGRNRLYQLRQFVEYTHEENGALNVKWNEGMVYYLGVEDFSEVMPSSILTELLYCAINLTIRNSIYSYHYPNDLSFIASYDKDLNAILEKNTKFVKLCLPASVNDHDILHGNRVPVFKDWFQVVADEKPEEIPYAPDDPRMNQTYRLITRNGDIEYIFYPDSTYQIKLGSKLVSPGKIKRVDGCTDSWPRPILLPSTRTEPPRRWSKATTERRES